MATRWLSPEEQAVWRAYILATLHVDRELDRQLQRDADMPVALYAVLVALSEAPQRRMRMRELAEALSSSQSRMTHAVASLERRGWVQREECPTDRRGQFAALTDVGLRALVAAAPGHVEAVRTHLFDRLSATEQQQLQDICERLLADAPHATAWPWVAQ